MLDFQATAGLDPRCTQKACQRTKRAMYVQQSRDHVRKALSEEIPDPLGTFLCDPCLTCVFKIAFQITSEQKCTRQDQILFVKRSNTEVSGSFVVPWFVGKIIFNEKSS